MRGILSEAEQVLGSPTRNLVSILLFVLTVAVLATIGYMAAGWSFADASYMVVLTIYTVGYGEIRPIDTPYLHAVTMGTMVLGCTGMILLTSALVQFFTVLQLQSIFGATRMQSRIDKLSDHVVICGYGRIGVMLARDLSRAAVPVLVIERGPERRAEAEAAGLCTLSGDATEEEVLIAGGIQRARALATVLPDDAANVFITLSARNLNAGLEIIARGEAPTTERKLIHAGADRVVFPTHIGAEAMARMILYPHREHVQGDEQLARLRRELGALGLEVEMVEVAKGATMAGLSVEEAERRAEGSIFIVQIDRADGRSIPRPARDERLEGGDKAVVVMRDVAAGARALFTSRAEIRAGRNKF
ncbi:potassium channel family protein [Sphingomonas pituitosa]|uniref:potassium channel family protein n=1 Tax=Sphingomonas pituitosa TaxID=99597 RepID=UPI000830E4D1|nr:potassium channel protein [Sphingomonas pituitosa]